jgi:cell division protein FtsB
MDSITNLLLALLIGLLAWLGRVFYSKLEELSKNIKEILISDMGHQKDIEQLKADRDEHEKRIGELEKNY